MRLFIVTQAVDRDDSDLGFFHRWIEECAQHSERVMVVCLRKGAHALPPNVEVIALGENIRIVRALELCVIAFGRRKEYEAVFAHMSPEFVVAAGWLWRLLGKKIGLWYVHKSVTAWLRIATLFAHRVFTASKESFRIETSKRLIVGHGIDTDFFAPDPTVVRGAHLLSVGRLAMSKRHDLAIAAAKVMNVSLRIAGEGPERERLEALAKTLGVDVVFTGGLSQRELLQEYHTARVLLHTSETGSLDKVVLEALACGCPVISTNPLLSSLPVDVSEATPEAIARRVNIQPRYEARESVEYVRLHHSLPRLIESLCRILAQRTV